jgi:hypothetical protein
VTDDLKTLTLEVTRNAGRLAGSAEAAAVLEFTGIGDERARRMGRANLFRLAAEVAENQEHDPEALEAVREVEAERRRVRSSVRASAAAHPLRTGIALALPIAAADGAIAILSAQQWTGGQPAIERTTAIGLAVVTSIPITLGFVLAMAARGSTSWRGEGAGVGRRTLRTAALGAAAAAVAGLGLWGLLSWKALVAPGEVGVTVQYFALLSGLWLASGVALAARRAGWLPVAFAAGIAAAAVMRIAAGSSSIAAEQTGILVAAALVVLGSVRRPPVDPERRSRPPAIPGGVGPLVLFGAGLGALLFVDRAAAWYSQSPFHSWILALRPDAEAGWDWAVVAMFGAIVAVAISAQRFGGFVASAAERVPLTAGRALAHEVQTAHRRAVRTLVLAAAVGAAVSFVGVLALMAASPSFSGIVTRHTAYVFAIVGSALVLGAWAVLDCAILFAMGRPGAPVLGVLLGLVVDAAVAVVLAKTAAGWTAAAGLAAGAVVFWAVTSTRVRRLLRQPDVALATRG